MKRYLWTGVAILCISLEASDNPFDLKTNLKNLDEEQSKLISELRESSGRDKFFLDGEIDAEEAETDSIELSDQKGSLPPESAEAIPPEKAEETQAEAKERIPAEAPESQGTVMAEEQKKAEKTRLKALEEERIAVEKYEAERLRKKHSEQAKYNAESKDTEKTPKEAVKAEAEPEQSLDIEKAMEQAKKEVEQLQTPGETTATPESTKEQSLSNNINLSPEKKEAKEAADRLYREAIKEVDAE
jgi:hypothetical protein